MENPATYQIPLQATEIEQSIYAILETVFDPEVPVLSVIDLGIVRGIYVNAKDSPVPWQIQIEVTPTYTGCPAMDVIKTTIRMTLLSYGYVDIIINTILSPAWTTDWMSAYGKAKLKSYGIAPPQYKQAVISPEAFQQEPAIQCPLCYSYHTKLVSQFGSTACKALYQCIDCKEPFDYFKCH